MTSRGRDGWRIFLRKDPSVSGVCAVSPAVSSAQGQRVALSHHRPATNRRQIPILAGVTAGIPRFLYPPSTGIAVPVGLFCCGSDLACCSPLRRENQFDRSLSAEKAWNIL